MNYEIKKLYFANSNIDFIFHKMNFKNYTEFANKLNIDRTLPEKIITFKQYPSIGVLIKIKELFNISIDDLIFKDLSEEQSSLKKIKINGK